MENVRRKNKVVDELNYNKYIISIISSVAPARVPGSGLETLILLYVVTPVEGVCNSASVMVSREHHVRLGGEGFLRELG